MSTQDMWGIALELEVALEGLYRSLSKRFDYDRQVSGTFGDLAQLKRGQVGLIRNQRRMDTRKGGPQLSVAGEVDNIRCLLDDAELVRRHPGTVDLLRAIELSQSLEKTAASTLYGSVEGVQDPIQASVIAKLQRDNARDCGVLDELRRRVLGLAS